MRKRTVDALILALFVEELKVCQRLDFVQMIADAIRNAFSAIL
jgi:hypothetical protein